MPIQLQFRRGTAAQWTQANTTLASGEVGFEIDTGYFKLGNGNTAWANLNYSITYTAINANNSQYLGGNTALTLRTYTEDKSGNAYSNSVTYTDTRIGVVNTAIVANAAAAYNNAAADSTAKATAAILYADYILSVANSNIIANAATAYTNATTFSANATNLTNGTIPYARFPANIINTTADFTRSGVTTFNSNLVVNTTAGISANGTYGTQGQALLSNGSSVYWATATAGSNTYIQFNDSGAANASAGFTFDKTSNTISVGNSSVNATINSTSYTGSASFVGGNTAATLRSYSDTTAATAYSNGVTYVNTRIGVVNTAITSNASAAYSNAVTYTDSKILTANGAITGNAATAYSNAVTYVDTRIVTVNTAITSNAATAYSNSVTYVDTRIGVVNTAITSNASTAYSNAVTYASNASNISTGTIAEARLPYRLNQNLTTTNNVTFANISLTGGTLSTLPVNPSDIVNKQYADAIATGVNFHQAVRLSTTVTFDATTATYNNGTNGVNATITDIAPYLAISLDGVTANYGDRVLMRTVSNTAWNGIYVVSNTGSASYPWILTRAFDYDQVGSGTNEIDQGDLIYVLAGSSLAGTSWVQQNNITTIGTDGISFVQFSSKALYPLTEGTGLYYSVGSAYDGSAAATLTVNTSYIGTLTSNNTSFVGTVSAANVVSNSQLSSNLANYQTTAGLSANVATLTSNNTSFVGTVSAANIVSNAQLSANLSNYQLTSSMSSYQTTAGLSANVATLTANNTSFVGTVTAANVVSNSQLSSNLANYQTTAGLSANVATLTANNTSFVGTVSAANVVSNTQLSSNLANYQTTAGLSTNVATLTANNTSFVGSVTAVNVVSNSQLSGNLANYQTTAGLSANVATLSSNNASYLGGVAAASYTNTSGAYTITGIHTHTANLVVNSSIIAGGNSGFAGQVLTSNGIGNVYWSSLSANLTVRSTNGNGGAVNTTVSSVTGINFDESTGLHVTDQGSGNVFVSLGSGYKYITVSGQTTITAVGEDTLNVANGSYIFLTTSNTAPKTLTISANLSSFQTTAGLSANVATLTSNNTSYVGSVTAANVVSNAQLVANLTNYQTTAGLSAAVSFLTANNTTYFNNQLASYYTNATNITTGMLPYAQIPANVINTTASFTIIGVHTHNANLVIGTTASISANGSYGTANQVLTSNGSTVYWANTGSGGFTNGQSISVANLVITGALTASSSNGTSGQVLTSNGNGIYWAAAASSVTAANATSQSFTGDGTTTTFTLTSSVANQLNIIVSINGLLQVPTTHYTITGTALSFTTAPYTGAIIEARSMEGVVISGGSGSVSASITITPKSAAYTLQASDNGGMVSITTGGVTVPSGVLSSGMNVTIYNNSASNQTIIQGTSTTMYLAGATTPTTGNRTLGPYGLATIISVGTDTFTISGPGVS